MNSILLGYSKLSMFNTCYWYYVTKSSSKLRAIPAGKADRPTLLSIVCPRVYLSSFAKKNEKHADEILM